MSIKEIPDPIPPSNRRIKKWSLMMLVRHDGEWKFEKTNHVRHYDMVLRKWVEDKSQITKEFLSLASQGVKKSHSIKVLVERSGLDPQSIRKIVGYFVVTLIATIPPAPEYEHIYLTVVKGGKRRRRRIDGHFVINDLACTTLGYQILGWNHVWVKRLPKEVRIKPKEARKMLDSGEIATIVPEDVNTGKFSNRKVVFNVRL